MLLLGGAIFFGGGGTPAPLGETMAILCALAAGAWALLRMRDKAAGLASGLLMLAVALPGLALLQLLPLPASAVFALPLRAPLAAAYDALGVSPVLHPLTMDPAATRWGLLSLIPPLVALVLASRLDRQGVMRIMLALVALAVLSGVLAGLERVGGATFAIYARSAGTGSGGLFANQNSQGDFLLIGMIAAIFLSSPKDAALAWFRPLVLLIVAFLALCVLLTGSRAAIALLAVPLGLYAILNLRVGLSRRSITFAMLPIAALATFLALARDATAIATVLDRFALGADGRLTAIWPDALHLAGVAFPFGTGIGTFPQVFPMVERLSVVDTTLANRAHCDWLEFAIEGGLPAILLLAGLGAFLVRTTLRKWREGFMYGDSSMVSIMALVATHSLVDYPLRSISLAVVTAIALGYFGQKPGGRAHAQV